MHIAPITLSSLIKGVVLIRKILLSIWIISPKISWPLLITFVIFDVGIISPIFFPNIFTLFLLNNLQPWLFIDVILLLKSTETIPRGKESKVLFVAKDDWSSNLSTSLTGSSLLKDEMNSINSSITISAKIFQ